MSEQIYYEFGYPEAKRCKLIKEKLVLPKNMHKLKYMGKIRELPVIEIPINVPIYRMENLRTKHMQKEWLAKNKELPKDLFTSDPEAIVAQEAQHRILETIIDRQNLLSTFMDESNRQLEDIIITDNGIVVNGNRRLAAWRKLYKDDPKKYNHYQTIDAVVLPDHDPDGVYELEHDLQISPDIKDKYKWHVIAADYKEKMESNRGALLQKFDKNEDEINFDIDCYDLAQEYLESIGHVDEWSLVDEMEYAFQQIVKTRKSLKNPAEKDLYIKLTHKLLRSKADTGRKYTILPKVGKNITDLTDEIIKKYDIKINTNEYNNIFEIEDEADEQDIKKSLLGNELDKIDDDSFAETVSSFIQLQDDIEKEKKNINFVFNQVSKASTNLNQAIRFLDDSMSKEGIDKQIENIESLLQGIKDWIKK